MISQTECYGLHWDGPIVWLVQGRKGSNFVGLKAQCPFQAQGGMCNHLIPTAAPIPDWIHWELWSKIFPDPLTQAMLPLPKTGGQNVFFIEDPYDDLGLYLATLSRLSSPINQIIKPIWLMKIKDLERELKSSNIQPLILVQTDQKSQQIVDTVAKLALYIPRTVVILGKPEVVIRQPIKRIKTSIRSFDLPDLMTLPLENIGATLIRRYARKEALDDPLESRADRRERVIRERSKP